MRFVVLGLSLSHPYAFADYLTARGHRIVSVWDDAPSRAEAFARRHGAQAGASPEEALAAPADAVIVTSVTRDHPSHARLALAAGLPVYIDKLIALTPAEADDLLRAGPPVMTGSALRFLPEFRELVRQVREGAIGIPLTATGTVYHAMKDYLRPGNTWQDDPVLSGGTLMNMGIHAVDLLVASLGPDWAVVAADRARRVHREALSEDQAAILLRSPRGELATIQVLCGLERHYYAFAVTGTAGEARWQFPDPARPVANIYAPLLDAFIEMVETGRPPVEPAEIVAAVRILAEARQAAPVAPG